MSRINCHSAFKHYEMFHSTGGDVINIGSNNTTIFDMGTGYSGGFWGGVGYGLGNAFGSVFSSMLGGSFGNFGGYSISPFSNMFMGPFGGISGFNMLDRLTKSKDSDDGKGKDKDSVGSKNIDYAKLNKLFKRKNDLAEAKEPKLADLKQLESDIDKLAKDLDGNDDGNDNDYIKQLKRGLDDKIKEAEAREAGKAKNDGKAGDAGKDKKSGASDGANNAGKPGDAGSNVKDADGAANGTGTEPWSGVSAWNNDTNLIPTNITLPAGYSKLGDNDKIDNIELAHDKSGKTKNVSGSSKKSTETYKAQGKNTNFPTYAAITTSGNNAYNYKCIGMSNGYPIYGTPATDINKNVYVMCKDPNGKVVLLQLNKFSGYGVKDAQN